MNNAVAITNTCSQTRSLRKHWLSLEREQKEKVVEMANGCTDEKCLLKILQELPRGERKGSYRET